jgi:hypothetical protein
MRAIAADWVGLHDRPDASSLGCWLAADVADVVVDVVVEGAQGLAGLRWGLGLVGSGERDEEAVVDLGVENCLVSVPREQYLREDLPPWT